MAVVTFDYGQWLLRFPELRAVPQERATLFFHEAELYLDNTGTGPVTEPTRLSVLLGLATAHLIQLNATVNGVIPSPLVGRVSSASEGSVSVSVDAGQVTATQAWWAQTRYGAAFWQATARYRRMRYVRPSYLPGALC